MSLIKCPNCENEIDSFASKCPHCGLERKSGKVTIIGYTEKFALNPSVSVFKNGIKIGKVVPKGKMEIDVEKVCELQFKCGFRSTNCFVTLNDWVLLSFNRTTGELSANITDEYHCQNSINQAEKSDKKRIGCAIILVIILLYLAYLFLS